MIAIVYPRAEGAWPQGRPIKATAAGILLALADFEETTQWGWIAFGVLAAAVLVGGLVWWLRKRRSGRQTVDRRRL